MMNRRLKKASAVLLAMTMLFSLAGCVDQSQGKESSDSGTKTESSADTSSESAESLLKITDPKEKAAVEAAKKKVQELDGEPRIIATSPATADICDKLELDLVGVCSSTVSTIPDRYKDVETVGTAMSPDTEILSSLKPDWILSPVSLQSDLQPKYEAIGSDWAFLNLRSVPGMYRSIQELGEIFDRQDQADKLVKEFTEFYDDYKKKNEGKDHPKVMILMGLPGSYIIATPNSYVGSLVELAGGENVYSDTDQEFLTVNTEDVKTLVPYVIVGLILALIMTKMCNLLALEDKTARSLGINVNAMRIVISLIAVLLASISTAVAGVISFLGLIVPHIGRILVGSDHKALVPFSALFGAFTFLLADTIGRTIAAPYEVSASIIMSVVGGPFFIILLRRSKKYAK